MTSESATDQAGRFSVRATDLSFAYKVGEFSLRVPHLAVGEAGTAAFIGPSGCGKTTLLRLLMGSLTPDSGTIDLLGHNITAASPAQRREIRLRRVGVVFQGFALIDYLSALDNITLPIRMAGAVTKDARDRAGDIANSLGIAHTLRRVPARLSQGERQRVAIARALVTSPGLIVCDEPTGNLDSSRAIASVDLIIEEAKRINAAVLFVTHDHSLLPRFEQVFDMAGLYQTNQAREVAE